MTPPASPGSRSPPKGSPKANRSPKPGSSKKKGAVEPKTSAAQPPGPPPSPTAPAGRGPANAPGAKPSNPKGKNRSPKGRGSPGTGTAPSKPKQPGQAGGSGGARSSPQPKTTLKSGAARQPQAPPNQFKSHGSPPKGAANPAASIKSTQRPPAARSPPRLSSFPEFEHGPPRQPHVPIWMQPDAAAGTSPAHRPPGGASARAGSTTPGRLRTLAGKLLPFVGGKKTPDTKGYPDAAASYSSHGRKPKLTQLSKRPGHQQGSPDRGAAETKSSLKQWIGERIQQVRSTEQPSHPSDLKKAPSITSTLLRIVVIAAVVIVLCLVALAITWRVLTGSFWSRGREQQAFTINGTNPRSGRFCTDLKTCTEAYETLLSDSIDFGVSPCENFYAHACGGWRQHHAKSSASVAWKEYAATVIERMRNVKTSSEREEPISEASRFLETCLNAGRDSRLHDVAHDDVKTVLAKGGITWPKRSEQPDFISSLFFMAKHVQLPVFFNIEVGLSSDGLLAVKFPLDAAFQATLQRFREHMNTGRAKQDVQVAYSAFSPEDVEAERLAEIARGIFSMTPVYDEFLKATDKQMQANASSLLLYAPSVPEKKWASLLKQYLKFYFVDADAVVFYDIASFSAIFEALRYHGEDVMNDVFGFLCIQATIFYTSNKVREVFFGSPAEASAQQVQYCFTRTYAFYKHAINFFMLSDASRPLEDLQNLTAEIRAAFPRLIQQNLGIDGDSLRPPQEFSLHAIFKTLDHSRPEFFTFLYKHYPRATKNALANWIALAGHVRTLGFRSGIVLNGSIQIDDCVGQCDRRYVQWRASPLHLKFPWYAPDGPRSILLAGLGARVAAAVFMDYVDRNMTSRTETYENNRECLEVFDPDLKSLHLELQAGVVAVRVTSWLLEEVAWNTTTAASLADTGVTKTRQLFFAFGCHLFCGDVNGDRMCNEPLRQSAEFARTFDCKPGSPMNPVKKCVIHV